MLLIHGLPTTASVSVQRKSSMGEDVRGTEEIASRAARLGRPARVSRAAYLPYTIADVCLGDSREDVLGVCEVFLSHVGRNALVIVEIAGPAKTHIRGAAMIALLCIMLLD